MKSMLLLVTAAMLVGAVALAQLHITSFDPSGEFTWTNSFPRGFYSVEEAESLSGAWNSVATVADLDWTKTNPITFRVSLTNAQSIYRVKWLAPDPIGVWDYRAYDTQGTLVVTGQLNISSMTLLTSNPPVVYAIRGSRDLQYSVPATNAPWWFGPQVGTGYFYGQLESQNTSLSLSWPTNCVDCGVGLNGPLGPNTYTGQWVYVTWVGPYAGPFTANRISQTNLINTRR